MITGFDKYTHELTEDEEAVLLPLLVKGLRTKIGANKAVTNKHICSTLNAKGYKLTGARVRKLISYIRINGLIDNLVSSSRGYYVATTQKEVLNYATSLLQREAAIRAVRLSFKY